jgi:hypothetical protein
LNLHPRRSLVRNIGHDFSGTNSRPDARFGAEELAEHIGVTAIPIESDGRARKAFRAHLRAPLSQRIAAQWRQLTRRVKRRLPWRAVTTKQGLTRSREGAKEE